MPENKVLKFKNYFLYTIFKPSKEDPEKQEIDIPSFQGWLISQELHGLASLNRGRFIKIIMDRAEEIDKHRIEIASEHAKNKKGEIEWRLKDGKVIKDEPRPEEKVPYDIKDMGKFLEEWEDYLNEDYIIDVTPANNEVINGVKSILLNTKSTFAGGAAMRHSEWYEAFEDIYKKDTPKEVKDLIKKAK